MGIINNSTQGMGNICGILFFWDKILNK